MSFLRYSYSDIIEKKCTNKPIQDVKCSITKVLKILILKSNSNSKSKSYSESKSNYLQKQSSTGVLKRGCSKNMQQIYRRTPLPKCDLNKVALQLY